MSLLTPNPPLPCPSDETSGYKKVVVEKTGTPNGMFNYQQLNAIIYKLCQNSL